MLILFDHSTPAPLRYALKNHTVVEAIERGWERLANGVSRFAEQRGSISKPELGAALTKLRTLQRQGEHEQLRSASLRPRGPLR